MSDRDHWLEILEEHERKKNARTPTFWENFWDWRHFVAWFVVIVGILIVGSVVGFVFAVLDIITSGH